MIDIKLLENTATLASGHTYAEDYKACLKNRKDDPSQVDRLLELNRERKQCIAQMETRKAEQNKFGPIIAQKKRAQENADKELSEMQKLAEEVKALQVKAEAADLKVRELIERLPNMCHSSVPVGMSDEDNKIIHSHGSAPKFSFKAKEHWELGENLGMLDFTRAGKVTGARFAFLHSGFARLERGLINFMLDLHTVEHGYSEMLPPFIVNSASLFGTGQFPKFKEDVFHLENTDYHLIPTAEVPVTNYFREEILDEADLPLAYAAYSPCFRSEAGTYGKDTRGLIRQHQFEKVELMKFVHPDKSYEEHERLTTNAEEVLKRLEIPFQRVALCTGDIGFGAAKCYDLNVWLPGQNAFREISSCSNYEDFQARRANIRFKSKTSKPQFVHTLNGSALAVGRTLIAIVENYQQEDGSIKIPKVLQSYMGGMTTITKRLPQK